jgi:hypothetical protein
LVAREVGPLVDDEVGASSAAGTSDADPVGPLAADPTDERPAGLADPADLAEVPAPGLPASEPEHPASPTTDPAPSRAAATARQADRLTWPAA